MLFDKTDKHIKNEKQSINPNFLFNCLSFFKKLLAICRHVKIEHTREHMTSSVFEKFRENSKFKDPIENHLIVSTLLGQRNSNIKKKKENMEKYFCSLE
ncbi:MAG: hypothetical protein LBU35_01050 [Holosporales bacterium]|jgi:hypothetical protein|nr:hypothetical protein [Holosporales bacterium]